MGSATPRTYPNKLRQARIAATLTQNEVIERIKTLAKNDPDQFITLSLSALKRLESGKRRPRFRTARTFCELYHESIEELFPEGLDVPRNPSGKAKVR